MSFRAYHGSISVGPVNNSSRCKPKLVKVTVLRGKNDEAQSDCDELLRIQEVGQDDRG
jgi:hypothetical protein